VSHTDPEILALRALGETAGTARDDEHAQTCVRCRAELARLTEIVDVARDGGPAGPLETPPPQVWDQIAAAVAPDAVPSVVPGGPGRGDLRGGNGAGHRAGDGRPEASGQSPVSGDTGPAAKPAAGSRRGARRGRLVTALAGLAAGLIIGIGGTAGVIQLTRAPAAQVVAQIELSPLPQFPQWQGASGTAVMRATGSQQVIAVTLNAPQQPGFYAVWLLARNGVSMISLGDLSADHAGTFTIPSGTDLHNYSRIDVSLQPFNGSTVHVKTSVVRGALPASSLGAPAAAS
jgi:Anti-sigma-K factor rskA